MGEGKCEFRVWAPLLEQVSLHIVSGVERLLPMRKDEGGYFHALVDKVEPGDRYFYCLNNSLERPDPASHCQPDDIFGSSCIVDHASFQWRDNLWQGIPLEKMLIYELHIGAFTQEGTFENAISKLPYLKDLGINTIEMMPVAQFSGARNWGYDGVFPFAVQNSYGGPEGLKRFVNECHAIDISVVLDVVYNHIGPEGNVLHEFMPCFTDKYKTFWGKALNLDDSYSHGVRNFFIQNALFWLENYHIDALRLDAIHGIFDMSAKHFLRELSEKVAEFSQLNSRKRYLIAESDLNDARVTEPYLKGGYGIDAQWNDDFHHCLHTLLTKETDGYYEDFGALKQLVKAVKEGFVYSWDYSPYRKRFHGSSSADIPASSFVVFSQNHDQTGNRMKGDRLSTLVPFEALKIAAGLVLLSSNIPLLFMGEEYGEDAPFLYFTDFLDAHLIEDVREGRKKEFSSFNWQAEPDDPFDKNTFLKSKLQWNKLKNEKNSALFAYYKKLIQIRKETPAFCCTDKNALNITIDEKNRVLSITRLHKEGCIYVAVSFNEKEIIYKPAEIEGNWIKMLDSSDIEWLGPGSKLPETISPVSEFFMQPLSLAVYKKKS